MSNSDKQIIKWKSIFIAVAVCVMIIAEHVCYTNASFPTTRMTLLMMLMFSSVIISRVQIKELIKLRYLVGILPTFLLIFIKKAIPFNDKISLSLCVINIVVYGVLLSFGAKDFFVDRKIFGKIERNGIRKFILENGRGFLGILMLLFMLISKNEAVWPVYFFVTFLSSLLIVPNDTEKKDSELIGIIFGIIAGFVVIQGHAFVLRPFDEERYLGMYRNSNINAMFYLTVLVALLVLLYFVLDNKAACWTRIIVLFLIFCTFSLGLLAGSRTVILIMILLMIIMGAVAVFGLNFMKGNSFKKVFLIAGELVLIATVALVISFSAVRYLPPLFHHPIWYYGEYSEAKVHSFDPINSEKYSNPWMKTFAILRRFDYKAMKKASINDSKKYAEDSDGNIIVSVTVYNDDGTVSEEKSYDIKVAQIAERDGQRVLAFSDGIEPGTDFEHPVFVSENYSGFLGRFLRIRSLIFGYYWSESSFWGNEFEWDAKWITPINIFDHAHNNVIEIAYNFGYIPAALYLVGFVVYAFLFAIERKSKRQISLNEVFELLVMISMLLFGLTECTSFGFYFIWWLFFYSICGNDKVRAKDTTN